MPLVINSIEELNDFLKNHNIKVPVNERALLYLDVLEEALKFINIGLVAELKISYPDDYKKLLTAITDKNLLSELIENLDYYTYMPLSDQIDSNSASIWGPILRNTGEVLQYLNTSFLADYENNLSTLKTAYPHQFEGMKILGQNFRNNLKDISLKVIRDWELLEKMFRETDEQSFSELSEIQVTGSDFHKGGKETFILTFNLTGSYKTIKIVFKPSDVEIDLRIAGNTEIYKRIVSPSEQIEITKSLLEIIKDLSAGNKDIIPLPVYVILPMFPGSLETYNEPIDLTTTPDTFDVQKAYGYLEYIIYEEASVNKNHSIFANQYEAIGASFFRQMGHLLAISRVFSLTDRHLENLIVSKFMPYLIDSENSLVVPVTDVYQTSVIGSETSALTGDKLEIRSSDLSGVDSITLKFSFRLKLHTRKNRLKSLQSRKPVEHTEGFEKDTEMIPFTLIFKEGFESMMRLMRDSYSDLSWGKWFSEVQNTTVRHVPFSTTKMVKFSLYYRDSKLKAGEVFNDSNKEDFLIKLWEELYEDWLNAPKNGIVIDMKVFSILPQYVLEDLNTISVPSFYHRVGTKLLFNAYGTPVVINAQGLVSLTTSDGKLIKRTIDLEGKTDLNNFFKVIPTTEQIKENQFDKFLKDEFEKTLRRDLAFIDEILK